MARDYSGIQLPYSIPHWKQGFAMQYVRDAWKDIPLPLKNKILDAWNGNRDLVLSRRDFDLLPDNLWAKLRPYL